MGRAEGVAGVVAGAVLWYAVMIFIVLAGLTDLTGLTGHSVFSVLFNAWLYFGSFLLFMIAGIYVFDGDSRKETKNVLKWLAAGILLWGLAIILLTPVSYRTGINPDQAYNISLFTGCSILLTLLAIRSFRLRRESHES